MALRGDRNVQIDVCVWCGGVFLDPGELAQLTRYRAHHLRDPATSSTPIVNVRGSAWPLWLDTLIDLLFP
jgi:Zn-finger nucleic acid-binding protein